MIDTVSFNHEVIIDEVTGEIILDNGWSSNKSYFSEKISPAIKGYTASKNNVRKISNIKMDSKNIEETVIYTKNILPENIIQKPNVSTSSKKTVIPKIITNDITPSLIINSNIKDNSSLPQTGENNSLSIIEISIGVTLIFSGFIVFI